MMTEFMRNVETALNPDQSFGRERTVLFFAHCLVRDTYPRDPNAPTFVFVHASPAVLVDSVRPAVFINSVSPSAKNASGSENKSTRFLSDKTALASLGSRLSFLMKRRCRIFLLFFSFALVRHAVGQGTTNAGDPLLLTAFCLFQTSAMRSSRTMHWSLTRRPCRTLSPRALRFKKW